MPVKIYPISLGISRCYLIQDKGVIMIDAGPPNNIKAFQKLLANLLINIEEIKLILLTHGDADHVGGARDIKSLSGAKIAIHKLDKINLEQARLNWPPGVTNWGRISRMFFKPIIYPFMHFPPTQADVIIEDESLSLADYGVDGMIVYTPGHTLGSISVLLQTGDAFVGCLAHNNFPFRSRLGFPIYAEDLEKVKDSWKLLIEKSTKMVYPAHGDPFSIDVIHRELS